MPPGTVPTPQLRQPNSDVEGSPHAVRKPCSAHAGAARPTMRRHPSELRKAQARRPRGDRRHRSAAKASMADAAMRLTSAPGLRHAAVTVPAPDRRGGYGLACCMRTKREHTVKGPVRRSSPPRRHQLRRWHLELFSRLLDGCMFVGCLDLAHPDGFVSDAVDSPQWQWRWLWLMGRRSLRHVGNIGRRLCRFNRSTCR
jgi:hypothetical protein